MADKKRNVTLKDIAAEAGVSMMTVSNVLNGRGSVSQEMSRRIFEIAQRLNYRPNHVARSLRARETKTLGVVVSDSSQLVLAKVIRAIEEEAAQAGYSVILANTGQDLKREKEIVGLLLDKRIDGLILAAPICTDEPYMKRLVQFGAPLVLLMRTSPLAHVNSVINDNEQGGYEIIQHLVQRQRCPIYFLSLPKDSQSGQSRIVGYRRALLENNLVLNESTIQYCEPTIEAGYQGMKQILSGGVDTGGVCCGCDLIAIGAIQAIKDHGYAVPTDFAVAGYDDIDLADYLMVPLTTMRQPKEELGRTGVRLLLDQIKNPSNRPRQIVLSSTLIVRQST